jgi:hypothetical protein
VQHHTTFNLDAVTALLGFLFLVSCCTSNSRRKVVAPDADIMVTFETPSPVEAEGGETGLKANTSKTAILLLDFQNEFAKPGGKLHDGVKSVMESTGMLNKVPHVVRAAR